MILLVQLIYLIMDVQFLKKRLAVFMAGATLDVSYFKNKAVSYLFYKINLKICFLFFSPDSVLINCTFFTPF